MKDLSKAKKDENEDIRHTYLKGLVNGIFDTVSMSIEKSDNNTAIILIGKGKEFKDCSFTVTYRDRYEELFKITFTSKNSKFKYVGTQKKNYIFSKDIAVKNTVAFFKKKGVDIDYIFHSQAEQYLFFKLIYKYISMLLAVLFEDYDCLGNARNKLVKKRYDEVFRKIRKEVNANDIIDLIYNVANIIDIEQVIDERYDRTECNIAYLVDTVFYQNSILRINNAVICSVKDYDLSSVSNIVMNKAGMRYQMFPFKNNIPLSIGKDAHTVSLRIWQITDRELFFPRYFWYVTKNAEDVRNMEAYSSIFDHRVNEIQSKIYGAAIRALEKKYPYDKRAMYFQWMNSLNVVLERIYTKNYNPYFSIDKDQDLKKEEGYVNLISFLKDNSIDVLNPKIIYIYLVSVAIDNICGTLENANIEEMHECIEDDEKTYTKHCSYMKKICDSPSIKRAIERYTTFYNVNKKFIEAFLEKVKITKESCWEAIESSEYNPYLFLKNSIKIYYDHLCGNPDKLIIFDINTSSAVPSDDKKSIEEIIHFENGKKYRVEFEACGYSEAPFNFIIINKKADGSLVSVFDKSDIVLTSDMQKYSFEFCYNGSDDDMCFLTYGYGTTLGRYTTQNLKIIEIN